MIGYITAIILSITLILSVIFITIDARKKRTANHPFISFIIPTYNNSNYIETAIKSIYACYNNFEIFVANDKSTDNTIKLLTSLKNRYNFEIIDNPVNKGKAQTINDVFDKTNGEIIFIMDTDIILNKEAINDMLARLSDEKVGGVSCRYKVLNRQFLPVMQDIEYNMLSFAQASHNVFSTISLWGGCMAFKRKAFEDIGRLSPNFLAEDMDAALKLTEHNWKVEQSNYYVYTSAPIGLKEWYKQKKRWSSGFIQNFLAHYKVLLKNPLAVILYLSYSFFALVSIYFIIRRFLWVWMIYSLIDDMRNLLGISLFKSVWYLTAFYSSLIIQKILIMFSYPLFSLPYLLYDKSYRHFFKLFLVFPFALIYYPMYMIMNLIGFYIGIKKYRKLKTGMRAW